MVERARVVTEPSPLSVGQEALWFLNKLAPTSSAYNLAFAFRIHHAIDVEVLRQALATTADRHDLLRSSFVERAEGPRRMVHDSAVLDVEVRDVPGVDDPTLRQLVREAVETPFRLADPPLVRVLLFRCAPADTVLLLAAHHIVMDAASQVVVVSDLLRGYEALSDGRRPALPEHGWTYADYVAAETALLDSPRCAELLDFWRDFCAGAPHSLDLPTDRPRPPTQRYAGSGHTYYMPVEMVHQLNGAARAVRVTPFVFLVTVFETLLQRYSGQRDFLLGCAASTRDRRLHDVVGLFVNPVLLRARFGQRTTFRQLAAATGEQVRLAMANREYPFALLPGKLAVRRDPSRSPLFQVLVSAVTARAADPLLDLLLDGAVTGRDMRYAGLPVGRIDMPVVQAGQFDLALELHMSRHGLTIVLKYATDLFDHTTIERLSGHFVALIESAIDHPDELATRLTMLDSAERARLSEDTVEDTLDW